MVIKQTYNLIIFKSHGTLHVYIIIKWQNSGIDTGVYACEGGGVRTGS